MRQKILLLIQTNSINWSHPQPVRIVFLLEIDTYTVFVTRKGKGRSISLTPIIGLKAKLFEYGFKASCFQQALLYLCDLGTPCGSVRGHSWHFGNASICIQKTCNPLSSLGTEFAHFMAPKALVSVILGFHLISLFILIQENEEAFM